MKAKEFLKSKGGNESPYGEVIWNFDTATNEWLHDLLEEYAKAILPTDEWVEHFLQDNSDCYVGGYLDCLYNLRGQINNK